MKYIIIILLFCKGVFSQTASLDTNSILIGEQVGLTISNEIKNLPNLMALEYGNNPRPVEVTANPVSQTTMTPQ